jgi:hypothetical protein
VVPLSPFSYKVLNSRNEVLLFAGVFENVIPANGAWNVGKSPPDYTAQHPRRQSSYSPPWESEIPLNCKQIEFNG